MQNPAKQYFRNSNNLLYSFLLSLPLFLLYEALILISQPEGDQIIRISVDVWIKTLFTYFGVNAVSFTLLIVALAGFFILFKERARLRTLQFSYFPLMLLEAVIYAVVVAAISQWLVALVINFINSGVLEQLTITQKIALSLGAGLYEELFFRVILVSLFILLFSRLFDKRWAGIVAAVVLAALIFSAVHYVGSLGDAFTMRSFLFRFIFGLLLNGIYVWRGFGVTAWTHAIYDILVIALLSA